MKLDLNNISVDCNYSKSIMHRILFCTLLSKSVTTINNVSFSDDVKTTIEALKNCNCKITYNDNQIVVDSREVKLINNQFDFNQSGTTLRFSIPVIIYLFGEIKYSGEEVLMTRPLDIYERIFDAKIEGKNGIIKGGYVLDEYIIEDNKSSQCISGLLFVLPLLGFDTKIVIKDKVSYNYILMTINVLKTFGINIIVENNIIYIKGNQEYKQNIEIDNEVDESSLSYLRALNFVGCNIKYKENIETLQPDHCLVDILKNQPQVIDCNNCPDLVPTLVFVCNYFDKPTTLVGIDRLKYKESNRLEAIINVGEKLGLNLKYKNDSLVITPNNNLKTCSVSSYNDHRIALMEILFSTKVNVDIDNIEVIDKSYPEFLAVIKRQGDL